MANAAIPASSADLTDEWQTVLSNQVKETFKQGREAIAKLNSKLFGGSDDLDLDGVVKQMQDMGVWQDSAGKNAITTIFSGGDFLADLDKSSIATELQAGLARMKLSLVAGLLRAQNFYVFINTQLAEDRCTWEGSKFIDGQCMVISKRIFPGVGGWPDTEPVKGDILRKLSDSSAGYNIDLEQMYQNALACDGREMTQGLTYGASFPDCFWGLPIVKVDGPNICAVVWESNGKEYPEGLKLDGQNCPKPDTLTVSY